jgi:hypothetical protein
MKFAKQFAIAAFLACAFSNGGTATTLARMNLSELTTSAEIIVRGRCIRTEVRQEVYADARGEGRAIWTFATFDVLETLKGAVIAQQIKVRLPGGQIGHIRETVEGVPQFFAGDEAVLFLERTSAGDYGITGWVQGSFRVHRSAAADSEPSVTQDSSGFGVFDSHTKQFTSTGIRKMPISIFRTQIAVAIAAHERKLQP